MWMNELNGCKVRLFMPTLLMYVEGLELFLTLAVIVGV
jgi:hypothetical protein